MPYSRKLYENMPMYARLFDAHTGNILQHICDAIQVEFDEFERILNRYQYFLDLPSILNDNFLDFLQQYVGLGYEGDKWIGVAINPDWPTHVKKQTIAIAWKYWQSKGTELGVRTAYKIWGEWEEAEKESRLILKYPFGELPMATPTQSYGWGDRYDSHLTQYYTDRKHLIGSYKPGFTYQPPGLLLEYPRWRWDYSEEWSPKYLNADIPRKKHNSQHCIGPQEIWSHFYLDLDKLKFYEWNTLFDRIREINAECWPVPYSPTIWAWIERDYPIKVEIRNSPRFPEFDDVTQVHIGIAGMLWGNLWRFPIYPTEDQRFIEEKVEQTYLYNGWRWAEDLLPGTSISINEVYPSIPEDIEIIEYQSWYGATWGDLQKTDAIVEDVGFWIETGAGLQNNISKTNIFFRWLDTWDSCWLWNSAKTKASTLKWITATTTRGPFEIIAGELWYGYAVVTETINNIEQISSGFNAIAFTWGLLRKSNNLPIEENEEEEISDHPVDEYGLPDPTWTKHEIKEWTDGNWLESIRWGVLYNPRTENNYQTISRLFSFLSEGWKWGEILFPGKNGIIWQDEIDLSLIVPDTFQSWYGSTYGDVQEYQAIFKIHSTQIEIHEPGFTGRWLDVWTYQFPWNKVSSTYSRTITATIQEGPFPSISGSLWYQLIEVVERHTTVVPSAVEAFNPTPLTWADIYRQTIIEQIQPINKDDIDDSNESRDDGYWVKTFKKTNGNLGASSQWGVKNRVSTPTLGTKTTVVERSHLFPGRLWNQMDLFGSVQKKLVIEIIDRPAYTFSVNDGLEYGSIYSSISKPSQVITGIPVDSGLDIPHSQWFNPWDLIDSWYWANKTGLIYSTINISPDAIAPGRSWQVNEHNIPATIAYETVSQAIATSTWFSAGVTTEIKETKVEDDSNANIEPTIESGWGIYLNNAHGFRKEREQNLISNAAVSVYWTDRHRSDWLKWAFTGSAIANIRINGNWGKSFAFNVPWTSTRSESAIHQWPGIDTTTPKFIESNFLISSRWNLLWNSWNEWNRNIKREVVSDRQLPPNAIHARASALWLFPAKNIIQKDSGKRGNWNAGNWWLSSLGILERKKFQTRVSYWINDLKLIQPPINYFANNYSIILSIDIDDIYVQTDTLTNFTIDKVASAGTKSYLFAPQDILLTKIWHQNVLIFDNELNEFVFVPQGYLYESYNTNLPPNSEWGQGIDWMWISKTKTETVVDNLISYKLFGIAELWQSNFREDYPEISENPFYWIENITPGNLWYSQKDKIITETIPLDAHEIQAIIPQSDNNWGVLTYTPSSESALGQIGDIISNIHLTHLWTNRAWSQWLVWQLGGITQQKQIIPDNWGKCLEYNIPWTKTSKESSIYGWTNSSEQRIIIPSNWLHSWRWGNSWTAKEWFRSRKVIIQNHLLHRINQEQSFSRTSSLWYTNINIITIKDTGERHTWNYGNWWLAPQGIQIVPVPPIRNNALTRELYYAPKQYIAGYLWKQITKEIVINDDGEEIVRTILNEGNYSLRPPLLSVRINLPIGLWNNKTTWYWELEDSLLEKENQLIKIFLISLAQLWQTNLQILIPDYDADIRQEKYQYQTYGNSWFNFRSWTDIKKIQILEEHETWEIGGTYHNLITEWNTTVIYPVIREDILLLDSIDIEDSTVTTKPAFTGVINGFWWNNIYPAIVNGYYLFDIKNIFSDIYMPWTITPKSIPFSLEISFDINIDNLVVEWRFIGTDQEKILWNYHNWHSREIEEKTEFVPGYRRFLLPRSGVEARYIDRFWNVLGTWSVLLDRQQIDPVITETPVVENRYFPNIFGFWSDRNVDYWEEFTVSIFQNYSPVKVYPLLQKIIEVTNWRLGIEIDGQVKLIAPTTFFWAEDLNDDGYATSKRSPCYRENYKYLILEFIFQPDILDEWDWRHKKIRGTSLLLEMELFDYRFYDWYGLLTTHVDQTVGIRYSVLIDTSMEIEPNDSTAIDVEAIAVG